MIYRDATEQALIYDYDSYLISENAGRTDIKKPFIRDYFHNRSKKEKERYAILLIKYVSENYLHWSPQKARDNLNYDVLREWYLDEVVKYITFPNDLEKNDLFYIVHIIWPKAVTVNAQDVYLQVYRRILLQIDGHKAKFPKGYFSGTNGINKACACLKYAIENYKHFTTVDEMYTFFGDAKKSVAFLKEYRLHLAARQLFSSNTEYLDYTLHPSQKNKFLFYYFNLWEQHDSLKRKKAIKKETKKSGKVV